MDTSGLKLVIGLAGLKAAGKGTLAEHVVKQYGFQTIATRNVIIDSLRRRGVADPTTPQMQDEGNRGRRESGDGGYWQRIMVQTALENGWPLLVCDGLRNPAEITALQELMGPRFLPLGIVAPFEVRLARYLKRAQYGDQVSGADDFIRLDSRDRGAGEPPEGQQTDRTLAMIPSEQIYDNVGTLAEYHAWIAAQLAKHGL